MTTSIKQLGTNLGLGCVALGLSSIAAAGSPGGTIVFTEVAPPALPVPTFGVMAAVILAVLFGAMALRTLHKNRQTFASIALISATLGVALMVASAGIVRAVLPGPISVGTDQLDQQLDFPCGSGDGEVTTTFKNDTGSTIGVQSIFGGQCLVNQIGSTCAITSNPVTLQKGETCTVLAIYDDRGAP